MKVQDLTHIADPYSRFVQSVRFLDYLENAEKQTMEIRDRALLDLEGEMSQENIALDLGVSQQRVGQLLKRARERYGDEQILTLD